MLINLVSLKPPVPFGGGKKGARQVVTDAFYDLDDVYEMNFIDFFGGSGLLSQWALEAGFREVVYNDFDDYLGRIRYFAISNISTGCGGTFTWRTALVTQNAFLMSLPNQ